ncbi:hypothetical protein AB0B54_13540 [Microbispora bryophytorum]|uniref:hypothetical protein n=1 Tax=Microbispora bryophytorum TaxID=1460882 RepID=UPI0033D70BD1
MFRQIANESREAVRRVPGYGVVQEVGRPRLRHVPHGASRTGWGADRVGADGAGADGVGAGEDGVGEVAIGGLAGLQDLPHDNRAGRRG